MNKVCPFRCSTTISPVQGGVQLIWDWNIKDKYGVKMQYSLGRTVSNIDIMNSRICPFEYALNKLTREDFKPN